MTSRPHKVSQVNNYYENKALEYNLEYFVVLYLL